MIRAACIAAASLLVLSACESVPGYYTALEQIGIEKRDLLVDRVQDTRGSQKGAQEAFREALDVYGRTGNADAARLEQAYNRFNAAYDNARDKAKAVESDIDSVNRVAADLFDEWQKELARYQDPALRAASERQLRETRIRYDRMAAALKAAEAKMDPVLLLFRDRVLFLKHNLNAQAVAQLRTEQTRIEGEVAGLVAELDQSIAEANRFIAEMKSG